MTIVVQRIWAILLIYRGAIGGLFRYFLLTGSSTTPDDSRWHECGHGTAFKTPWMNEVVYQIASFMV